MNTKQAITVAVIIGIVVIVFVWFTNEQNSQVSGVLSQGDEQINSNQLSSPEPFFDFGTIPMSAGTVSHTFKIKNANTEQVVVTKIYTSCMCTIATLVTKAGTAGPFGMPGHATIPSIKQNIAPDEEASVEIVFDPAAHGPQGVGKVRRIVYLETGGGPDSALQLSFEATVTP